MIAEATSAIDFVMRRFFEPAFEVDEGLLPLCNDQRRTKAQEARLQILPMDAMLPQRLPRAAQKRRTEFIQVLQFIVELPARMQSFQPRLQMPERHFALLELSAHDVAKTGRDLGHFSAAGKSAFGQNFRGGA